MSSNIQQLRRSRLRILPGSILLGNLGTDELPAPPLEPPPEPPTSPPPDPTEIVRLVVLGDRRVGKSRVVQKFVSRRYCNPNDDGGDEDGTLHTDAADSRSVRSGRSHKSHHSSRSHRSEKSHRRRHRDRDGAGRHRKTTATSSSRYPMSPDGSHVSGRSADSRGRHHHNDGEIELIKAEYHKKDVTMWLPTASALPSAQADASKATKKRSALRKVSANHSSSYAADDRRGNGKADFSKDEQDQVCARVQVWDATGQDSAPLEDVENDGAQDPTQKASIISTDSKWSQIFRNAAGAVIVCTLGEGDGSGSCGMTDQYVDRQAIMDKLERRIRRWLALVDAFASSSANGGHSEHSNEANAAHRIPVTLILNKSDQISNVLSSSDWVRVGAQMERLCEGLGIDGGWYTSTCLPPESGDVAQDSSSSTSSGSWNEDHDGAEMAFLSLIRSNLLAKRESSAAGGVESDTKKVDGERREDKSPRRRSKSQTKGGRQSLSRRRRSRSRSRPRAAPNFPIDP